MKLVHFTVKIVIFGGKWIFCMKMDIFAQITLVIVLNFGIFEIKMAYFDIFQKFLKS